MVTVRQKIIDDNQVRALLADRMTLLDRLSEARTKYNEADNNLAMFRLNGVSDLKSRQEEIEAEILYEISMDANLKNENQRKASLAKQLKESEEHRNIQKQLSEAEINKQKLEQLVVLAKAEYESARYALLAWQSTMDVVAGLSNEQNETVHTANMNVVVPGNGSK